MTALTGQTLIASNIDRGICLSGLVVEPVEICVFDQGCIVDHVRRGIRSCWSGIKILSGYGLKIVVFRYINSVVDQGSDG